MVLHLPGSMSIMALITLSKESISLFSFLLHAPQQKHRRKLKSCSNAVWLRVTDTSICFQLNQNKMTWEVYLQYNPLFIYINFLLHSNVMCKLFLLCSNQCYIPGSTGGNSRKMEHIFKVLVAEHTQYIQKQVVMYWFYERQPSCKHFICNKYVFMLLAGSKFHLL